MRARSRAPHSPAPTSTAPPPAARALVLATLGPRTSEEARERARARPARCCATRGDDRPRRRLGGRGRGWFVDDQGRDLLHGDDPQARS